jgi:hypothetical protein
MEEPLSSVPLASVFDSTAPFFPSMEEPLSPVDLTATEDSSDPLSLVSLTPLEDFF